MRLQLGENAKMAFTTLRENKVRSFLTVLGVVIGITLVISVASILVGLDRDLRGFLNDYGTDTLFVFKFNPGLHVGRLTTDERTRKPLTLEDALAIRELCPSVKAVTADVFPRVGNFSNRRFPTATTATRKSPAWITPARWRRPSRSTTRTSTKAASSPKPKTCIAPTSPSSATTWPTRSFPPKIRWARPFWWTERTTK